MRIKFGKFLLADDNATIAGPIGLEFSGSRAVQVDEGPRWEHPQVRDRKNRSRTMSFACIRTHDTYGHAEIFCAEHDEELPVTEVLTIEGPQNGGGSVFRRCDKAALLAVRTRQTKGIETEISYSFLIPEWRKSNVPAAS